MIEPQKLIRYRIRVTGGGYGDTIFEAKFNRKPTFEEAKEIAVKYQGALKEDDHIFVNPIYGDEMTFIL